jgi:hypothetical protein
VSRAWLLALACVCALGCERGAVEGASSTAPEPAPARQATDAERAAVHRARGALIRAWRGGAIAGLAKVRRDAAVANAKRATTPPSGEDVRRATIVFSSNNRGEREDCGCKRNPLGGLARRGTLIDLAIEGGEDAKSRWGRLGEAPAPRLLYVDAGDMLFKDANVLQRPEARVAVEAAEAAAVIEGMNALGPDAVAVGAYDLAAGWSRFDALRAGATFPFVSANLRVGGEAPLPSHVVVERDGVKVALIGLTAPRGATQGYSEKVGVSVADPIASYREAVAAAGEVDLVVLLSNAGVVGSQELIEGIRAADLRLDAVVASGTGAQTTRPKWTSGVPVVEPNARGKYVGRVDVWLKGEGAPTYANDVPDVAAAALRYTRAIEGYSSNRAKMMTTLARTLEASVEERELEAKVATVAPEGEPLGRAVKGKARAEGGKLARDLEFARKRVVIVGEELSASAVQMDPAALSAQTGGDDWAEATVVPVKIDIAEKRSVKRAIDAASR